MNKGNYRIQTNRNNKLYINYKSKEIIENNSFNLVIISVL